MTDRSSPVQPANSSTRPATQVEALLDSLIAAIDYVPKSARAVRERRELPLALQGLARVAVGWEAWRAWMDAGSIWFVTGRLSRHISEQLNRTVLHVFFYERDGRMSSTALWAREPTGHWQLREASGATTTVRKLDESALRLLRAADAGRD